MQGKEGIKNANDQKIPTSFMDDPLWVKTFYQLSSFKLKNWGHTTEYIPDDLMMATGRALGGWGGGGYNEEPGAELSDTWGELEK